MSLFLAILAGTVRALFSVLEICFLIRAVLSWFPIREDNPILLFVTMVTEPLIAPIRALFQKFGWFRNLPIDISFMVAYFLLLLIEVVLGIFLF